MRSQHISASIHKIARRGLAAGLQFDDMRVIAVWHKADILTVRLIRVDEAVLLRQRANVRLAQVAERKARVRQLLLRHGVQHIALILGRVDRLFQHIAPVPFLDSDIMAGDHTIAIQNFRPIKQLAELHIAITIDAGIRRNPVLIAFHESANHRISKIIREIEHVESHTEFIGDAARILHILQRTAVVRPLQPRILILKQPHRTADAFVSVILHQLRRQRGIHAPAHCNQRSFHRFYSYHSYCVDRNNYNCSVWHCQARFIEKAPETMCFRCFLWSFAYSAAASVLG